MFQFTRPRGARQRKPSKKATKIPSFNSRARVGRDPRSIDNSLSSMLFQFTRPRGARRGPCSPCHVDDGFNSRARVGRDRHARPASARCGRFQFTRPRGARLVDLVKDRGMTTVSIHAPAWGATGAPRPGGRGASVSIHAPAWGATE